ncbi:MAG TPA: hypothetical protein VNI34_05980 [Candidatus Nitrosotalea sp.]|nr:hypothetical protein [Candidatus Nitrosotalea sp.]
MTPDSSAERVPIQTAPDYPEEQARAADAVAPAAEPTPVVSAPSDTEPVMVAETADERPTAVRSVRPLGDEEFLRFRARFQSTQADFIDDPKKAVDGAQRLVEEFIGRIADGLREEVHAVRRALPQNPDTDVMRQAVQNYRELLNRFAEFWA